MHMLIYILCCLMRLEIIIKDSAGFAWNRWADFGYARCCFKVLLSQWYVQAKRATCKTNENDLTCGLNGD